MDPHETFCHNRDCWAYGRVGEGHVVIRSKKERRYRCKRCSKTFSATKGSALPEAQAAPPPPFKQPCRSTPGKP